MKKGIIGVLLLSVMTIGLAACSSSSKNAAGNKEIKFFVSGDASEGGAYTKMAKKYEKETGTKVQVTDVPYSDFNSKITKAVQANDAPDVARVPGALAEWTKYLADISSVYKNVKTLDSMTVKDSKGKVRAMPTDITANGMFINTSLFDEAGVDYPKSDKDIWTWDEFLKAVKIVQSKTKAKYGFVMDASDQRLRTFTYQYGGKDFFLNKAGTAYTTDTNTKKALQKFVDLNNDGTMPKSVWTSGQDASSLFKSGLVPAYLSGSWQIKDFTDNVKNFKWKSVYMPYEKTRATNLGGNFIVAFKNGKNPTGAKKFIKWLYKSENYKQLCEYAGYMPAIKNFKVNYKEGQSSYNVYSKEIAASSSISGKQVQDGLMTSMKGMKGLTGSYKDSIIKVLNGEISLNNAIKATEKDYNNMLVKQ